MGWSVPKKHLPIDPEQPFGERLATLRRAAGFTQRQLERVSGISHRMIAYYEGRDAMPPGHVLSVLAEALGVSADELLGRRGFKPARASRAGSRRLLRRLEQMERLPLKDKRELFAIIDAYLERHRLVQRAG